ncbi:MAG TPA: amidohydrolase family protein [Chloroflexota bacterium]|nr:amidohydrolase family protein [Chloroflexota bacterium]
MPPRAIDVHAHALSPKLVELTAAHGGPPNPHNEHLMETRYRAPFTSLDVRLETMDRQGIDMQVVSHMPNFAYWAEHDLALRVVEAANTLIAELCQARPDRFIGLGLVALQFPELAARQTEEAMNAFGMRGVEIGTFVEGMELGDDRLEPFWANAERLGALVFLHPAGSTLGGRLSKYYLSNVIGNPLDTTIALTHLIFSGVLERHPNLKIVAAHGGGYLPSYFPRTIHGFEVRPEAQTIPQPPDYYLKQLWVDALVYDPRNVAHVVERMGSSRVLLGTDYPFDMGEEQPLEVLAAVPGLSDADRQRIKVDNALELLGMAVAV